MNHPSARNVCYGQKTYLKQATCLKWAPSRLIFLAAIRHQTIIERIARISTTVVLLLILGQRSGALFGQVASNHSEQVVRSDSARVIASTEYAAGSFHRFMMGDGYRDLWTAPITVPILNLSTYAGGLTPIRKHTGSQTTSLRFLGADGREYQFRSVDKDPRMVLSPVLRPTLVGAVIKDGVSSTHPYGGVLAAELLEIAGILHVTPVVMVMPDDPALGEYREQFAGMLGSLEVRANENRNMEIAFSGALSITASDKLYERINRSPSHRINREQFLKARLVDLFIGDRDRHRDNWRWANMSEPVSDNDPVIWEPISRDHDHAFEHISGVIPFIATNYSPGIFTYGPEYPPLLRLTWNGQEVDRRFLAGFSKATWISVAAELKSDFSDEALERVVHLLPDEYFALDGERLLASMIGRRDNLLDAASRFYRFLAEEVEIHATDANEDAIIDFIDDRTVDITIRERKPGATPWFHRRFFSFETDEIRLRMFGGDDHVVIRGRGDPDISLRIAAGKGKDVLTDSTAGQDISLYFYDQPGGEPYTRGRSRKVNQKNYDEWIGSDLDRYPPREWGALRTLAASLSYNSDFGLIVDAGFVRDRYGFRKAPYANQTVFRVGISSDPARLRIAFSMQFQRENSKQSIKLNTLASGLEMLHYYGQGNDTSSNTEPSEFYDIRHRQYHLDLTYIAPLSSTLSLEIGPTLMYSNTEKKDGRLISLPDTTIYGTDGFGQVGVQLGVIQDTRNQINAATSGYVIESEIRFFPAVWDVSSSFTRAHVVASTYFSRPLPLEPTLAVRVGADKVWGRFPFQESAFIGGHRTIRGWHRERFAGDTAVYGNLDLRLFLTRFFFSVPGRFGVFGILDTGRVYVDGASPGGWHTGAGGGIWLSALKPTNVVTMGVTFNEEQTAFFLRAGFDF